ncbi:alpha/beta fold hydrolase [Litoribacter alkaliphilus]|uniref:Alpha/beta fold hydrolase n=1 Tax=Litoribacter ruber TaxID=702568 RepID=A0AAP2CF08_9BACT|nr:alpha/beta fold hydrolase [Litoribacter alkaliphilus]MBS9522662.1 alpha/beta fold hydrolase [Litoribacter alkaliphilus]
MQSIDIKATDGFLIKACWYSPTTPNERVVVISAATGVRQEFYGPFASHLADLGYTVYTYDYRGIGKSSPKKLKGFDATMRDWASKDFKGITEYIHAQHPSFSKFMIGHSVGGIFMGLSDAYQAYDGFITVAAQHGYWKHFDFHYKPLVLSLFHVILPTFNKLYGYFPSHYVNLGEPLPYGVAKDWRILITHPNSIMELAAMSENHYADISQPFLSISIDDDLMAPKKAVDRFAESIIRNASVKRVHVNPKDHDTKSIGHINFFRKKFSDSLWKIPIEWLESFPK